MLEGLYTAAAGMAAQERRLDALSNDIANVNTAGYKKVRIGFRDLVYQEKPGGVSTGSGTAVTQLGRGAQQGALRQTDQTFDLAIQGEGFFRVRREDGEVVLTRNGSFTVDGRRQVVNSNGERLVPPITLPAGVDPAKVSISRDGTVTAADGRRVGRIQLVTVPAPNGLAPAGDNNYEVTPQSGAIRRATGTLTQGVLESSNVDIADAMVDMMDSQRSYQMASKAINMQDRMWEIANGLKR